MLFGWEANRQPGKTYWQPTVGFMTKSPTGRLSRDWDQLLIKHPRTEYMTTFTFMYNYAPANTIQENHIGRSNRLPTCTQLAVTFLRVQANDTEYQIAIGRRRPKVQYTNHAKKQLPYQNQICSRQSTATDCANPTHERHRSSISLH